MPFVESNGLRYYRSEIFPPDVTQAIFTRRGGMSPAPWESLNVGGTVGDEADRVRENRIRSFNAVGRRLESMFDVWQVHSADSVMARAPRKPEDGYHKADIIATDRPEVTLYMRFADCVPILLYDRVKAVVCMAHAGWLGTVRGAARAAGEALIGGYGSRAEDLLAVIGPSIGPDHYEVGADVLNQIRRSFGADSERVVQSRDGRTYLDLWTANRIQLEQLGVMRIEMSAICTACHTDDWFSHRAEKGRTGRFGALLALPS